MNTQTQRRLQKEYGTILKSKPTEMYIFLNENNIYECHFSFTGAPDSPFEGGLYHGKFIFPIDYPRSPPELYMLNNSGRFAINKKLCLTFTSFHPETWTPTWTIETMCEALRAFMLTAAEGAVGGIDAPADARKVMAKESVSFECPQCGCKHKELIKMFAQNKKEKLEKEKLEKEKIQKQNEKIEKSEKVENKNNDEKNEIKEKEIEKKEIQNEDVHKENRNESKKENENKEKEVENVKKEIQNESKEEIIENKEELLTTIETDEIKENDNENEMKEEKEKKEDKKENEEDDVLAMIRKRQEMEKQKMLKMMETEENDENEESKHDCKEIFDEIINVTFFIALFILALYFLNELKIIGITKYLEK